MPQKKNADSLELIRGKSGRIFGRVSERRISSLKCFLLETSNTKTRRFFVIFSTRPQVFDISPSFSFQCAGMQMTLKVKTF